MASTLISEWQSKKKNTNIDVCDPWDCWDDPYYVHRHTSIAEISPDITT